MAQCPVGHTKGKRVMSGFRPGVPMRNRQEGFTLIEVMIALVIASIALAAIFATFNDQHKAYIVQNAVAEMQGNVRGAMQFVDMQARNAGAGIPPAVSMAVPSLLFNGVTISMVSGFGVADGGAEGTDNLYIISLTSVATTIAASMPSTSAELKVVDPTGFTEGAIAIIYDDTTADIFQITKIQSSDHIQHNPQSIFGDENKDFQKPYAEGSHVALVSYSGFYVDRTDPAHPALVKDMVIDNVLGPHIVADDIEDFQVRLVLSDGSEIDPVGVTMAQLTNTRALRFVIVGRTRQADPKWNESAAVVMNHANLTALAPYNHYRRRVLEERVDLRNAGLLP